MKIHRESYTSNNVLYYDTKKYLKKTCFVALNQTFSETYSQLEFYIFSNRILFLQTFLPLPGVGFYFDWPGLPGRWPQACQGRPYQAMSENLHDLMPFFQQGKAK